MGEFTYMRKLLGGMYQASVKTFFKSDTNLISDECMGDWMEDSFAGVKAIWTQIQTNPGNFSYEETQKVVHQLFVNDAQKTLDLCEVDHLQASYDTWCQDNQDVCEGNGQEFVKRAVFYSFDIMVAAFDFFTVAIKNDQCETDQQKIDELIPAYEELVKNVFLVYDFDAKW